MKVLAAGFIFVLVAAQGHSERQRAIMRNCLKAQITEFECRGYSGQPPIKQKRNTK